LKPQASSALSLQRLERLTSSSAQWCGAKGAESCGVLRKTNHEGKRQLAKKRSAAIHPAIDAQHCLVVKVSQIDWVPLDCCLSSMN